MIILKIGGGKGIVENLDEILRDFAALPGPKILVHGANHEMRVVSEKLGRPEKIITSPSGFTSRYTDRETLEIFEMVYSGVANKRIVEKLQKQGVNAIGLSGIDGRLWEGKRKEAIRAVEGDKVRIIRDDFTGTVEKVNSSLLKLLLDNGYVPVLTPPAISYEGEAINVDNDRAAAVLASGMGADTIVMLFEAPGLLADANDPNSLIRRLSKEELSSSMDLGEGRMKKKLLGSIEGLDAGVKRIVYGDGRIKEPIKSALAGNGTIIE